MTGAQLRVQAQRRYGSAQAAFAAGDSPTGWVNLLASGMDQAAAVGRLLDVDLVTVARTAGFIE